MTRRFSFILLFASIISTHAEVHLINFLEVSRGMSAWDRHMEDTGSQKLQNGTLSPTGYMECAETREIPGAYLCGSFLQTNMNRAFLRASVYSEGLGNIPAKTIARLNDPSMQRLGSQVGGHDIPGPTLVEFYQKLQQACVDSQQSAEICPSEYEKEVFEEIILPIAQTRSDFVLITWASRSNMGYDQVVTHEILHAQYFLTPEFRDIVDLFWEQDVDANDKVTIQQGLYNFGYSGVEHDKLLLINEFQAYMLMARAHQAALRRFVPKYRAPLLEKLQKAGVSPVQVN